MIVTRSSIFTPEGYVIDIRNRTINKIDIPKEVKKIQFKIKEESLVTTLRLKDFLECQKETNILIKEIKDMLDPSILGKDVYKIHRKLDDIE